MCEILLKFIEAKLDRVKFYANCQTFSQTSANFALTKTRASDRFLRTNCIYSDK